MMFHGMGQVLPTYNQDPFGQWCAANPTLANVLQLFPGSGPLLGAPSSPYSTCLSDTNAGGQSSAVQAPSSAGITQAYVTGSAPVVPAEGYVAGTAPGATGDSAQDTINQILSQTQQNAVANATAAAAAEAAANAAANPPSPTACDNDPNSFLCWFSQHTTALWVGLGVVGAIVLLQELKGLK